MPDENRSERLRFDSREEPLLQRALLVYLLDHEAEWHTPDSLIASGELGDYDRPAIQRASGALRMEGLILVSRKEEMAPSSAARHFHWLMTEVEPLDG